MPQFTINFVINKVLVYQPPYSKFQYLTSQFLPIFPCFYWFWWRLLTSKLGSIHIWRQMFFGHFWPTYPHQILYYISLFSKIRWGLTYLPTQKSDVIYECSHSQFWKRNYCNQFSLDSIVIPSIFPSFYVQLWNFEFRFKFWKSNFWNQFLIVIPAVLHSILLNKINWNYVPYARHYNPLLIWNRS